ncbi:MAG: CoA transferase [Acidimicrobiales bacterium]|nr:CoA transferase [Acidimicrobiales bacterium]RZV47322.1 MAG: CoA transferase [Acidimicrobiales bacterium]
MSGPLAGVKVIELASIGPGPFCAMMLADMGAEVIRVDRAQSVRGGDPAAPPVDVLARGRKSIGVDLKHPDGVETVLQLIETADILIEGLRPGVTERLGIGPDDCLDRNPKLVYGRMTGWGQDGPMASQAGHDINYIALSGTLSMLGRNDTGPVPPINLVGDFGGGGMLLAFGLLAALTEARASSVGQVVDAAMVDGAATLAAMMHSFIAMGMWDGGRGGNMLDTGAHFYDVYETADAKWISLGGIEPQFYAEMLEKLEIDPDDLPAQHDRNQWPRAKSIIAERVAQRTRAEWDVTFTGSDACYAPVLEPAEAMAHPHNVARKTFISVAGVDQPAPAPRFSRTPSSTPTAPAHPGQHTDVVLKAWGFADERIEALRDAGAIA